ncbi:MAG: MFS transporter [Bifidobacteriaceae bacterium]|jgi:NNP family nitrate/nitrite transporter-like MFS transporter|nr:MFS transporter [Bifidobacteriaceae bacterium]
MNVPAPSSSARRWIILGIAFLVAFAVAYSQFTLAGRGPEIAESLKLSTSAMSAVGLAPMLPGVFFGLVAGGLADRFGVKLVVTIAFVCSVAGAIARIWAGNFALLLITMFLLGMAAAVLAANAPKLFVAWFPPEQIGIAMGVFMAAGALGTMAAQATASRFATTTAAFGFGAVLVCVSFVLWLALVSNRPPGAEHAGPPPQKVTAYLGKVARNPFVWLMGLGMVLFMAAQMTFAQFLPTALTEVHDMTIQGSGGVASLFTAGTLVGSIAVPLVARKLGRIKPVVITVALLGLVGMYVGWMVAPGGLASVVLVLGGIGLGAAPPMIMAGPALLPSIGPEFAGSAGGLIATLQMAGAYVVPTFVFTPIAGANFNLLLALAAVSCGLIALVMAFVPEYGVRLGAGSTAGSPAGSPDGSATGSAAGPAK